MGATQIFGGRGYIRGSRASKVERLYREVRAMAIAGGSEEILIESLKQLKKSHLLLRSQGQLSDETKQDFDALVSKIKCDKIQFSNFHLVETNEDTLSEMIENMYEISLDLIEENEIHQSYYMNNSIDKYSTLALFEEKKKMSEYFKNDSFPSTTENIAKLTLTHEDYSERKDDYDLRDDSTIKWLKRLKLSPKRSDNKSNLCNENGEDITRYNTADYDTLSEQTSASKKLFEDYKKKQLTYLLKDNDMRTQTPSPPLLQSANTGLKIEGKIIRSSSNHLITPSPPHLNTINLPYLDNVTAEKKHVTSASKDESIPTEIPGISENIFASKRNKNQFLLSGVQSMDKKNDTIDSNDQNHVNDTFTVCKDTSLQNTTELIILEAAGNEDKKCNVALGR